MSTSFENALARARQIAAKIGGNIPANGADSGKKRSFNDNEDQPEAKKVATDDITQQLRNIADQQRASQAAAMAAAAASQINAKLGIVGGTTPKPLISNFQSTAAAHGLADPQEIARMLGFSVNTTEQTTVPDKMVGYLIGKGGEQITSIQAEAKCVVQFVAESDGTAERTCILTGTSSTIMKAKEVLDRLIGNFRAGGTTGNNVEDGANQLEMFVPGTKVGLIIGKSGDTIKGLMEATGTKIIVIQESNAATPHEKPVRITGDKENCMAAKQKIMELISDNNNSNNSGMSVNSYGTPMMSGDGKAHTEV